jgi:exosome complex component CSL4
MENKDNEVMIGDYLGTIEEFFPGEGTYSEDGKIFAGIIGKKIVDKEKHSMRVKGNIPLELKVGHTVFGEVQGMNRNYVNVIVKKVQGYKGETEIKTGLYVSNISEGYIKEPGDVFGIGDIVKGKIIKIYNELIDVSTKGAEFGVVKAFCKRCRNPLKKKSEIKRMERMRGDNDNNSRLVCENCGRKERRKIANDYGDVKEI